MTKDSPRRQSRVTAVVPVYGESPYLRDLLDSLSRQSETVEIVAAASNIGTQAQELLRERAIPLVRHQGSSIGQDWNNARAEATSRYFFFAHQDDIYRVDYAATLADLLDGDASATMAWCDYAVIGAGAQHRSAQTLPLMKRAMNELFVFGRTNISRPVAKKWLNAFGPVMGCPTVMFRTAALDEFLWNTDLTLNVDWDAWYRLAREPGSFVRSRRKLVEIRLHEDAESSVGKSSGARRREDTELLARYWPRPVASAIQRVMEVAY